MTETKKRGRPPQHKGERDQQMQFLSEMQDLAQKRIKSKGRAPLSAKLKLDWAHKEEGYHYMWASDSEKYPVSLQQMCEAGYTFVTYDHGSMAGEFVVQNSKGCNLYLMRQPNELFQEDQEAIHKKSIDMHKEIMGVGAREYAGESKELGKGKVADLSFEKSPDAISLMEGEQRFNQPSG